MDRKLRIAYLTTGYYPGGGVFESLDRTRETISKLGIESEVFIFGRKRKDTPYNFLLSKNLTLEMFDDFDLVELYQCWGLDSTPPNVVDILLALSLQNRLIFRINDTKSINSKSTTNYKPLIELLSKTANFLFIGYEEEQYIKKLFDLKKTAVVGLIYKNFLQEKVNLGDKDKIVVASRIDFCKGLEFIKKYLDINCSLFGFKPFDIHFYSSSKNDKFVYFTKFDKILNSNLYHKQPENIKYQDFVFKEARILLNFTWWGEGSGGRPEYTIVEGWEYGVVPIVDKRWVENKKGVMKDGYNCIGVERNNLEELHNKIELLMKNHKLYEKLVYNGYETLEKIKNNDKRLVKYYYSIGEK